MKILAVRFESVPGCSSWIVGHGIAFIALGVIWLMGGASAVATCLAPLTLGGLLLAGRRCGGQVQCEPTVQVPGGTQAGALHPQRQR